MAKKPTPLETRREARAVIAGVDLELAKRVQEIFSRPEMVTALEELREIHDDSPGAAQTGAAQNVNALIKSGITLLEGMAAQAASHVQTAEAILNPPPAPPPPPTPAVLPTPGT